MLDVDPHVTRHTRFEHTVDRVTRAFVFLSLYVQKVRGTQGPETAPHDLGSGQIARRHYFRFSAAGQGARLFDEENTLLAECGVAKSGEI